MFLAREGRLDKKDKDGASERDRLSVLLKRRDPRAVAALEPLDYPFDVHYLRTYGNELRGRSGEGRITHVEIAAWAGMTGRCLQPHETRALVRIVDVMDFPPDEEPDEDPNG